MEMIKLLDVTKQYKNGRGVAGINLSIKSGEIYGLLGANGAGKTTIFRAITGLTPFTQGNIIINNITIMNDYEKYMKSMGCIVGDVSLYPHLTALQHMKLVMNLDPRITVEKRDEILHKVGIYDVANNKVSQFSTGMKQRLAFAMVVIKKPKVLILDEPFSGMDIEGKSMIREYILELAKKENVAVIIASHLIYDVEDIADRIGVLEAGKLIDEIDKSHGIQQYESLEKYFVSTVRKRRESA